jgi:sec-independent protein translocase protein TatA
MIFPLLSLHPVVVSARINQAGKFCFSDQNTHTSFAPPAEGTAMFEGLFQPLHLLIIMGIVLIIFGPGKLPELGASLGKGIRDFKKAMADRDEKPIEAPETKKIDA